ncbi:MAG TPA: hypothetical protein V6D25_00345 [Leptolyngbyaceae cyanobacterium]
MKYQLQIFCCHAKFPPFNSQNLMILLVKINITFWDLVIFDYQRFGAFSNGF